MPVAVQPTFQSKARTVTTIEHVRAIKFLTAGSGNCLPKQMFRQSERIYICTTIKNDGSINMVTPFVVEITIYDSVNSPLKYGGAVWAGSPLQPGVEATVILEWLNGLSAKTLPVGTMRIELIVLSDIFPNSGHYIPNGYATTVFTVTGS